MEDIIVRTLLEDHDGPHQWRTLLSAHYWRNMIVLNMEDIIRTMMVLTMEDIIVLTLLEDHDSSYYEKYYYHSHIIRGSSDHDGH
ncbi:13115_t:CDS:2 [Rhizophagus irregularis]|nr:13115_t:CDS:2 [Rhizophagus irregularis]